MNRDFSMTDIYDLLYRLGVTANYVGFFHTAYAVKLCAEQPDRLLMVTKWLYPEVAKQYKTSWRAVERNIRAVRNIIWQKNRPLLEVLAYGPLLQKPRNVQMLSILAGAAGLVPSERGDVHTEPEVKARRIKPERPIKQAAEENPKVV